jgi:hypothetical protein
VGRLFLLIGLGLPLVLAGLSGCGGETRRAETETETAAGPLPVSGASTGVPRGAPVARVTDRRRRAYIVRTDRICRHFDPERAGARKRVGEAPDIAGAVRAYGEDTALGAAELRQIEAVPPPPGDAALLRANVFKPIGRQLALRARIRAALSAVDVPRLRVLRAQADELGRELSAFARGYGWRACGEAD